MKKITLYSALVCLMGSAALSSCSSDNDDIVSPESTLHAITATLPNDEVTRTVLAENGTTVNWQSTDAVKIANSSSSVVTTSTSITNNVATFSWTGDYTAAADDKVYYPSTFDGSSYTSLSSQTATAGSFDPSACLLSGTLEAGDGSLNASMQHCCAYVKLTISNWSSSSLTLYVGTDSYALAGSESASLNGTYYVAIKPVETATTIQIDSRSSKSGFTLSAGHVKAYTVTGSN